MKGAPQGLQPRRAPDVQAIFDAIGESGETGRSRQGPGLRATGPAQSVRQSETARPRQHASLASAPSHGTLASLDANLLDANLQAGQQANRARVEEVASLIGHGVSPRQTKLGAQILTAPLRSRPPRSPSFTRASASAMSGVWANGLRSANANVGVTGGDAGGLRTDPAAWADRQPGWWVWSENVPCQTGHSYSIVSALGAGRRHGPHALPGGLFPSSRLPCSRADFLKD